MVRLVSISPYDPWQWPIVFGTSCCLPSAGLVILRLLMAVLATLVWIRDMQRHWYHGYYFIYLDAWWLTISVLSQWLLLAANVTARNMLPDRYGYGSALTEDSLRDRLGRFFDVPLLPQLALILFTIGTAGSLMPLLLFPLNHSPLPMHGWTLAKPLLRDVNPQRPPEDHQWTRPHPHGYMVCAMFLLNLISLGLGRINIKPINCIWNFAFGLCCFMWTILHFWLRIGTSKPCDIYPLGECPIYSSLDWHHPGWNFAKGFFLFAVVQGFSCLICCLLSLFHSASDCERGDKRRRRDERQGKSIDDLSTGFAYQLGLPDPHAWKLEQPHSPRAAVSYTMES